MEFFEAMFAIQRDCVQARAHAALKQQWMMDAWKLEMGMLEIDMSPSRAPEEDTYFDRRWNRRPIYGPRDEPYRMLPTAPGWCILVRDKRK